MNVPVIFKSCVRFLSSVILKKLKADALKHFRTVEKSSKKFVKTEADILFLKLTWDNTSNLRGIIFPGGPVDEAGIDNLHLRIQFSVSGKKS